MTKAAKARIHLKAVRDEMASESLDYYAEHIDYIIKMLGKK